MNKLLERLGYLDFMLTGSEHLNISESIMKEDFDQDSSFLGKGIQLASERHLRIINLQVRHATKDCDLKTQSLHFKSETGNSSK